MSKLHIHWHAYQYTIAQIGDLYWWDLHKCRCNKEKIKNGEGYSPNYWLPKDIFGRPLL